MRRGRLLVYACAAAVAAVASVAFAGASKVPNGTAGSTVLVGFRSGARASAVDAAVRSVHGRVRHTTAAGTRVVSVTAGGVPAALARLRALPSVRFAEPDRRLVAAGAPNDAGFGLQWAARNTGQTVNGVAGTAGADERAVPAWSMATGSRSVVVAVVDTGLDYNHPDLAANVWTNPGGVGGCPAGTRGYNVVAGSCDPMDDDVSYGGHGTHVAGIIGAVGNNGIGVSGVDWTATLLPVKWLDANGNGDTSALLQALDWVLAAKQAGVNVRVVNDSATFFGTAYSQALSDEIDTLGANGILFVTAAGNTGDDNDDTAKRRYPCGYDRPTEICATATNQSDALPSWANYGAATVDLAAPGDNIYSTLRNGGYGYVSGGSMAAAQVSGAAALVLSVRDMPPQALKADILQNVDPLPSLAGKVRTGGRLDVCKTLPGCSLVTAPINVSRPRVSGRLAPRAVARATKGTWRQAPSRFGYQWLRCKVSLCVRISGAHSAAYRIRRADVGRSLAVAVTAANAAGSATATSPRTRLVLKR